MSDNSQSRALKVLVVGCGDIAGGYDEKAAGDHVLSHAGAYRKHPGFVISACIDPNRERRKAFMTHWGIEKGYDSLDDYERANMHHDVASICSPTATHDEFLERLLGMNTRGVLCEKPMTDSAKAGEQIVEAYERASVPLGVNYMRRWDPEIGALRKELTAGEWGAVRSAACFYAKGLMHTGGHMIDLLNFLVGPLTVDTVLSRRADYTPEDPTTDAVLRTAKNAPIYLVGGDCNDYARFELTLSFEEGVIEIFDSGYRVRRRRVVPHRLYPDRLHLEEGTVKDTGLDRAIGVAVDNLHSAITDGATLASTGRSALAAEGLCRELSAMPVSGECK